MDVLRHCAACSGRSADWFTLHNTHLAHQAAFYDAGLIGKYLSAWSKNFFVLDQLGGEYLQKNSACASTVAWLRGMFAFACWDPQGAQAPAGEGSLRN